MIIFEFKEISCLKAFFNGLDFGDLKLVKNCDLLHKFTSLSKLINEKDIKDQGELIELREDIVYNLENKELISDIMAKLKFINIDLCDNLILKLSFFDND